MNLLNYKNIISPRFLLCLKFWQTHLFDGFFYLPKLMDVYLFEGTTWKLAKFYSYYGWQSFSYGQLVSNSTHNLFAYLTCKGN